MGKKPVLGMVSALCVGLALTGCRDTNNHSDGALTKSSGPAYKSPPAFSMNAPNAMNNSSPLPSWNNNQAAAGKNPAWTGGTPSYTPTTPGATIDAAGMRTADPMNASHMTPNFQTIGTTAPPAPPTQSGYEAPSARPSVPAPAGEVHVVPGATGRILPAMPSFVNSPPEPAAPPSPPEPLVPPTPPATGPLTPDAPTVVPPPSPIPVFPPVDPTPSVAPPLPPPPAPVPSLPEPTPSAGPVLAPPPPPAPPPLPDLPPPVPGPIPNG